MLTIEYDGRDFYGWQRQPNLRTVQGELERALSKVCAAPVLLNGTSRTDAGVHALGQRASFKGDYGIPTDRIALAANNLLVGQSRAAGRGNAGCGRKGSGQAGDVRILKAQEVPEDFHARFDAKGKKYRYVIYTGREPKIFRRDYCYGLCRPLDTESMREASAYIVGEHDFAAFQSAGGIERETTVREVWSLEVLQRDKDVVLEVCGNGFLYNMVRIIAGTLVEVGLGLKRPEEIPKIIESADRRRAGHKAPAAGLYLVEVYY